jgi:hypothetical protein
MALDIDAVEEPLEAELQRKKKTGSMVRARRTYHAMSSAQLRPFATLTLM